MTSSPETESPENDWFDSDLHWFMEHVQSLAMTPEECCIDQGNYFVAGELHYFLCQPLSLLEETRSLLSVEQMHSIERLRASVKAVPVEARSGPPTAAGSLKDMQHAAWQTPRRLAIEVMEGLGPFWRERTRTSPER